MRHHNSLMHELLKLVPWSKCEASVDKYAADRGVRTLDSKSHLVALLHAQLSGAASLREIVATMASQATRLYHLGVRAPKRSTLADANASRPAALFADLFNDLLPQAHRGLRKASKEAIRLVDATSISLSSLSKDWASYEAHGCAAKLHVVFDPGAQTPVHFAVTPARTNDITAAKAMPIEAGRTYVFDLGYYDFGWWAELIAKDCRFVTRLKRNTPTRLVAERPSPRRAQSSPIASYACPSAWPTRARTRAPATCARSTFGSTPARFCASSPTTSRRRLTR
jgi:hypothetical protein